MSNASQIIAQLEAEFSFLVGSLENPRPGRIVMPFLDKGQFTVVFDYVVEQAGFDRFHLVIGTDEGEDLGFVYVLSDSDDLLLLLKLKAPKSAPQIDSVSARFANATWHERELVDLFGADVCGLPEGPSYPLPDGWPAGNYPLRKEWQVEYFDRQTMTYNPPPTETEAEEAGDE